MSDKIFYRVVISAGVFMVGSQFFAAGLDAHRHAGGETLIGLVNGMLWILITWLAISMMIDSREAKLRREHRSRLEDVLSTIDTIAKLEKDKKLTMAITDAITRVIKDVTKGKKVKASDAVKIEKAFHDKMPSHWAQVKVNKEGANINIATEPFKTLKVTKVPIKKTVTKKKGTK